MKNVLNPKVKMCLWLLAAMLMLSTVLNAMVFPVRADDPAKLFIDPKDNIYDTSTLHIGDNITVNVALANITGLVGTQFRVYWNASILNGTALTEVLYTTNTPEGEEDNIWKLKKVVAADHVEYAYSYLNVNQAIDGGYAPINITTTTNPPDGKRTVATITLKVIAEPLPDQILNCSLHFTNVILGDIDGNPIGGVSVVDGYYELSIPPRPTPTLKVEPATYEATHRNETFDVNVTMNNLDAGWQAIGVEFKIGYDPALLKINSATEGPFMAAFAEAPNQGTLFMKYNKTDFMQIAIMVIPDENGTWHEPFPSGSGTLATITFEVIRGPVGSCVLDLFDTIVSDWNTTLVDHTVQDGAFTFDVETLQHSIVADSQTYVVTTRSNATVSPVMFVQRNKLLTFTATGPDGGVCFVNITIPNDLLWLDAESDDWLVYVGGFEVTPVVGGDSTHTWLYFTFETSLKPVQILGTGAIPEFSTLAILPLLFAALAAALLSGSRKFKRLANGKAIL